MSSTDEFKRRMDDLVTVLKAQPRAEDVSEVLMPGEPESRAEEARLIDGIPLQQEPWREPDAPKVVRRSVWFGGLYRFQLIG